MKVKNCLGCGVPVYPPETGGSIPDRCPPCRRKQHEERIKNVEETKIRKDLALGFDLMKVSSAVVILVIVLSILAVLFLFITLIILVFVSA
jgi:hypothetical protein